MSHTFLKDRGYTGPVKEPYKYDSVSFYKRVPGTCHQWIVREHSIDIPGRPHHHSFEVEMIFETTGHIWANTHYYGLSEHALIENLQALEQSLYSAVVPMGGSASDYQCGDDV